MASCGKNLKINYDGKKVFSKKHFEKVFSKYCFILYCENTFQKYLPITDY